MTNLLRWCLVLLLGACGGSGPGDPGNPIRFGDLEVGQISHYATLIVNENEPVELQYVDGVLAAEIVDRDATGFRVREAFTVPEDVDERVRDAFEATEVYEYYLRVDGDTLRVLPVGDVLRARLFPSFGSRLPALGLADVTGPVVEIDGWTTTLTGGGSLQEAVVVDGAIRGTVYSRLNVLVNNEVVPVDGPSWAWLYSGGDGVVRATRFAYQSGRGHGFDRLGEPLFAY